MAENRQNSRWDCGTFHCFLIFYCLTTSIQKIPGPLMGNLLQSIERQFQIPSKLSGTLVSASDIGHVVAVVLLAYLGSKGNRARWVGAGGLLIAFASLLIASPSFLFPMNDGEVAESSNGSRNASGGLAFARLSFSYCNNESARLKSWALEERCRQQENSSGNTYAFWIMFTGLFLIGVSKSIPHTIGTPLIDDNIKNKRNTGMYFAAITCLRIFGPLLGMALSALSSRLYVNLKPSIGLTPLDPKWIGAWWLGFLIVALLLVVPSIVLMFYPKLEGDKSKTEPTSDDRQQGRSEALLGAQSSPATTTRIRLTFVVQVVTFLAAILEILRSPIYTGRLISNMFNAFAWKGMAAFQAKFLENHFGLTMFSANIYIGLLSIGSFLAGVVLGSWIMRRFNLDGRRAAAYVAVCSIIGTLITLGKSFLSCQSVANQVGMQGHLNNYTYPWCAGCDCSSAHLYPVCSVDGGVFYSPCHAGCGNFRLLPTDSSLEFTDCSCVNASATGGDLRVSRSFCQDDCAIPTIIYFGLSCLHAIIAGTGLICNMLIGLRSVPAQHRSTALAFSALVIGLVSVLPSTPIYGMVIDGACRLWNTGCGGRRGACLIYDPHKLRRSIIILYVALHSVGDFFDWFVWYKAKNLKLVPEESEKQRRRPGAGGNFNLDGI